ncbi:hypothetical protein BGX31_010981, partial [Mortierella sp. GBA43]
MSWINTGFAVKGVQDKRPSSLFGDTNRGARPQKGTMVLGSIVSSPLTTLSPQKALNLANAYLENAYNACDQDIALVFCHDTEVSLSHARKAARRHTETPAVIKGIATAYIDLGRLLEIHGYGIEAQLSFKKGEKLG